MTSAMGTTGEAELTTLAVVERVIKERRSVKEFDARPVPRALIDRLIEMAVWAPNHRLTEPWRFYVLDGASRERLGQLAGGLAAQQLAQSGAEAAVIERKADEAARAWATVPALLFVTARPDANPDLDRENYGAACCAVQNLMLAAQAAGLATSWSTGAVAMASELRQLVGAAEDDHLVGLFRLGYPAPAARASRRTPGRAQTTWVDAD